MAWSWRRHTARSTGRWAAARQSFCKSELTKSVAHEEPAQASFGNSRGCCKECCTSLERLKPKGNCKLNKRKTSTRANAGDPCSCKRTYVHGRHDALPPPTACACDDRSNLRRMLSPHAPMAYGGPMAHGGNMGCSWPAVAVATNQGPRHTRPKAECILLCRMLCPGAAEQATVCIRAQLHQLSSRGRRQELCPPLGLWRIALCRMSNLGIVHDRSQVR